MGEPSLTEYIHIWTRFDYVDPTVMGGINSLVLAVAAEICPTNLKEC